MTTISFAVPTIVLFALAVIVGLILWHGIGDWLLGRQVWSRLAQRDGNLIGSSRWFWQYAILAGPITWAILIRDRKEVRKQRNDSWKRRHDPEVITSLRQGDC